MAPIIVLQSLVRGQHRRTCPGTRSATGSGVRGIDHRDAEVLLQRSNMVRSIVGAVTGERRSILRIMLPHLGTGRRVPDCSCSRLRNRRSPVLQRGLTLQSAFGPIPRTTNSPGNSRSMGGNFFCQCDRSAEQQTQQRDGCNCECPDSFMLVHDSSLPGRCSTVRCRQLVARDARHPSERSRRGTSAGRAQRIIAAPRPTRTELLLRHIEYEMSGDGPKEPSTTTPVWFTPGLDQSHTPSGKILCNRVSSADVNDTE